MDNSGSVENNGGQAASLPKIIRDAAFAQRFKQACDKLKYIPRMHAGRLGWIRDNLIAVYGVKVSIETVRKWFAGEVKPRPDKLANLALLLEVQEAWLSLGIEQSLQPREVKAQNAMANGAVNLVAGLIQMDGGHIAFPSDGSFNEGSGIDLHAIIRGAKYDLNISLGVKDGGDLRFNVPVNHQELVVLGVIRTGFSFEIFDVSSEKIETGNHTGLSIDLLLPSDALNKIENFKNRI